ncbi:unnamed protein product, partial [Durusdinium trenchii]
MRLVSILLCHMRPNLVTSLWPAPMVRVQCFQSGYHAGFFSFSNEAGLTGAPELDKSQQLLGKLLAYGFSTSDEPLRAHCSLDNAIGNGEVLYLKGQLRVVTTLAFLAVVHQKNVDKEVHSSLQHVMALGVKLTDRTEELFCGSSCGKDFLDALFYNLRVGTKGQIRTAPSAVTWVNSLMELAKTGDKDSQATIAAWNGQAAKADRVVGNQFMTVKNLLDMNAECRSMLFAYINSPYNEDLLSSKKIQLGSSFKTAKIGKQSPWAGPWSRVTKDGLALWIQFLGSKWDKLPAHLRKKPTKAEGEQLLEQCYLSKLFVNLVL